MAQRLLYSMDEADMAIKKQKNGQVIEDTIPEHIIEDILLKLPPKSLLRFNCLSKSLRDMISSPFFRRAHLQKNKTNPPVILSHDTQILSRLGIDNVAGHINLITPEELLKNSRDLAGQIYFRFESGCDGILCIRIGEGLILCNPSIRKPKLLIVPGINRYKQVRFGIGYDLSIDDYKIIKFAGQRTSSKGTYDCEVEVLTLKSNECRRLSYDLPYVINFWSRPVSVNGVIYWLAYRQQEDRILQEEEILCFDLASETSSTVELPPIGFRRISGLMELEGKVGCFCETRNSSGKEYFDVWVMEENQTWVRMITISNKFKWISIGHSQVDMAILTGSADVDAPLITKVMNLKLLCSCNSMIRPIICCASSLISLD